jgi:hypothetical protein
LVPGKSLLITPQMLALVRGITTGGSTIHYYATSFPVPFDMLMKYGIDISDEVKELKESYLCSTKRRNGRSYVQTTDGQCPVSWIQLE